MLAYRCIFLIIKRERVVVVVVGTLGYAGCRRFFFCGIRGIGSDDERTDDTPSRITVISLYISSTRCCDVSRTCCVGLFAGSVAMGRGNVHARVCVYGTRSARVSTAGFGGGTEVIAIDGVATCSSDACWSLRRGVLD